MFAFEPVVADDQVTFADGRASGIAERFGEGQGLSATFGPSADHKLELTLFSVLSSDKNEQHLGEGFVLDQATKKRASAKQPDDRAVLMESGGELESEGKTDRVVHWQIGAGNCVFTLTITAPVPMSRELDEFLGQPLNEAVNTVGCNAL